MTQNILDPGVIHQVERQIAAIRDLPPAGILPKNQRFGSVIKQIGVGGFVRISGKTYKIEEVYTYQESNEGYKKKLGKPWQEFKLFCVDTGEVAYLEWEEDDQIDVYFCTKALKFSELRDDAGGSVDEDDLEAIVDEEDSLFYGGVEFEYDDDYAAIFRRENAGEEHPVYVYEFFSNTGRSLTIEEWPDPNRPDREDYEIWLSEKLTTGKVEILLPKAS